MSYKTIEESEDTMVRFSLKYIELKQNEKGEWKKNVQPHDKRGWQKLKKTDITPGDKVMCLVTGATSGVTVIDLDNFTPEQIQEFAKKYCLFNSCFMCPPAVKTRRGAHLYFQYTPDAKGGQYPEHGFDICNDGQRAYYTGTSYVTNEGDIFEYKWVDLGQPLADDDGFDEVAYDNEVTYTYHKLRPMSDELLGFLRERGALKSCQPVPEPVPVPVVTLKPVVTDISKFEQEILNNIKPQMYYSYGSWCKFIWAIKFSFETELAYKIAVDYSKSSDNFQSEDDVKEKMNQATDKRIGWGYLMNMSKMSNKREHYLIMAKHHDYLKKDDYSVAMLAIRLCGDDVIRTIDNEFYIYKYPYWVKDAYGELRTKICSVLRDFYAHMNKHFAEMLKECDDEDARKGSLAKQSEILQMLEKINNHYHSKQVYEEFKAYLDKSSIDFDTYKPYYFCFQNCAFDLRYNTQVKVQREDYITQTTGYDYIKSSPENIRLIKNLMEQIFPKEDSLKCYVSVLRSCMIGKVFEKFILANGNGGNGKGLINSLMEKMLGSDYFYRASITTLTEKMKDGPNPAVANMHKKRMVVASEPGDKDKLALGNIKALTGDSNINARGLYQTKTAVKLMHTMILECNKKPGMDGRVDDALIRRFINIIFESTFTDKKELLQYEGYFKANTDYKTEVWQENFKCVLFDYLLSVKENDIVEPKSIQQATFDYLCENDEFTNWLDSRYTRVNDANGKPDRASRIKLKDMCRDYKEKFLHPGSREYRQVTTDKFLVKLTENIKWKHTIKQCFSERFREGGLNERSVFLGLKRVKGDDSGSDSE